MELDDQFRDINGEPTYKSSGIIDPLIEANRRVASLERDVLGHINSNNMLAHFNENLREGKNHLNDKLTAISEDHERLQREVLALGANLLDARQALAVMFIDMIKNGELLDESKKCFYMVRSNMSMQP